MPRPPTSSLPPDDSLIVALSPWLTRLGWVLTVGVVFARATMLETLRDPHDLLPGAEAVARGPGPASGLVLDLIACLPALLVLGRRVIDPAFSLRIAWSALPMLLLGCWAVLSVAWSADRFAAAVSASHLLAAFVLLWSTAQLTRGWLGLRLVAAACFALLLVMIAHGLYYRFVELEDLRAHWERDGQQILEDRGWEPGSFSAMQFERRVLGGEMLGFTSSANSFGALMVLLGMVTGGFFLQKLREREWDFGELTKGSALLLGVLGAGLFLTPLMLWYTGSRTALATSLLGIVTLAAIWPLRRWLARRATAAYLIALAGIVVATAAVIAHGLSHGTLFHISLTFRWRYWIGSYGMFTAHPWIGVGWENFGLHYLGWRLPIAAEEVRDPHNFVVRFFTELGIVGGALMLAWMLRMWWELTRPAIPPLLPENSSPRRSAVAMAAACGVVGVLINIAASVDFEQGSAFALLEVMKRLGYLCVFVLGFAVAALRSAEHGDADDRPAPLVLYASLVALGLFLLHNLVDFSLFEPGPMLMFAMVAGAALGVRSQRTDRLPRPVLIGTLAGGVMAWLAAAVVWVGPVIIAETRAAEADDAIRAGRLDRAATLLAAAHKRVPSNADYVFRAARALYWSGRDGSALLEEAITQNPLSPKYLIFRANVHANAPTPDWAAAAADYRRALEIDPQNVGLRLDYAAALREAGDRGAAREQLERALQVNDQLAPDEPERLSPERVREVEQAIEALSEAPPPADGPAG